MPRVHAQAPTLTIEFGIPQTEPITPTNPPTEPGDVLIITGRPTGSIDAHGCSGSPGFVPVENAVVVDAGAGVRATRLTNIVILRALNGEAVLDPTPALAPGTRVVSPIGTGVCSLADGGVYA